MVLTVPVAPHPLLDIATFITRAVQPTSRLVTPAATGALCRDERPGGIRGAAPPGCALSTPQARAPFSSGSDVRTAVRDLLRHGGFKPAGRSKPASEYLAAAFAEDRFPRINALVDTCNVVSLHSGLPISLVDVDKLEGALAIRVAPPGTTYVFNPTGQIGRASCRERL